MMRSWSWAAALVALLVAHASEVAGARNFDRFIGHPPHHRSGDGRHQRYAVARWLLDLRRDGFTGELACTLETRDHSIIYRAGAAAFRYRNGARALDAWERIDDGAPRRFQDDLPELIRSGLAIEGKSLIQPTDGIVWVPRRVLLGADQVRIRLGQGRSIRRFHMTGLALILAAAEAQGCGRDLLGAA